MTSARILVASNRGPVSFSIDEDDGLTLARGGGGLVSGLTSAAADGESLWVCAALSEGDRRAAAEAPGGRLHEAGHDLRGMAVRMLQIDQLVFDRAYNAVANRVLWFTNHLLYATAHDPTFDRAAHREWQAYETYNRQFAAALVEEAGEGAKVLVQDYHLTLVPRELRQARPDVRIAHFTHTPWAPPDYFRLLPDDVAAALLRGMLGADHLGFLTRRWADAFLACCQSVLGVDVADSAVTQDGHRTEVGVHPLGVDGEGLRARAAQPDVRRKKASLRETVRGRKVVVRVDRTELSKNIVRGILAFRQLLVAHPDWVGRVVHIVLSYPSRHDLPEYREYTADVLRAATEVNDEFGTEGWQPVRLEVSDDYPRSLAAQTIADVLVVNPVRDGMNLVAKEGPVLNENEDGLALVLSREAGAAEQMGDAALLVNPFDVVQTAETIHRALSLSPQERRAQCARLAELATALPPQAWFAEQVDALERVR